MVQHAFRTTATGSIDAASDLGTLGGAESVANGINASGQTVGYSYISGNRFHAFRSAANGSINAASDLGTLGGNGSNAFGINVWGQVVGSADTPTFRVEHAFRTTANGNINAAPDLGTLGGLTSLAYSINASGQTVGYSDTNASGVQHAFFVDVTGPMVDLNTLIDPAAGRVLNSANGINDSGQIAGTGTIGGQQHAFLLTPTPEPASLSLLALGGMALFRRARCS